MKSIHMLLVSTAVLVAPATSAFAQDGEVQTEQATEDAYSDNEIIVTATRRDQAEPQKPAERSVATRGAPGSGRADRQY